MCPRINKLKIAISARGCEVSLFPHFITNSESDKAKKIADFAAISYF
jgi:hypothetical protein